ncbi:hypothetical protein [Siphonobacter aquaeclarae]|uniref:Uncharacterized protein n=1 Tax=Siphonobacter aquaeclarae TaxID=563176 RepID=A0A1G9T8U7_9BACT|nr:hypothetical protein [Siphonobacter aquaeclarae]SDM44086.1 hypothetical protein SAMN04488090_3461 [Siphonobacter aquaeclarae]
MNVPRTVEYFITKLTAAQTKTALAKAEKIMRREFDETAKVQHHIKYVQCLGETEAFRELEADRQAYGAVLEILQNIRNYGTWDGAKALHGSKQGEQLSLV